MLCNNEQSPCDVAVKPVEKKGCHWVPLLIMVVLVLCCTALFHTVPMETGEPETSKDTPWFSVKDGILYFDKSKYTGGNELTVPKEINGTSVIAISAGCFRDCENLSTILLPDNLEAIGEDAFRNCTALRGMEIPESVVFIGKGAFSGCSALEAVCVSNKLQQMGADAFDGCIGLHYVYFLGNFQEWAALSQDFILPTVIISCDDGNFYQSGDPT